MLLLGLFGLPPFNVVYFPLMLSPVVANPPVGYVAGGSVNPMAYPVAVPMVMPAPVPMVMPAYNSGYNGGGAYGVQRPCGASSASLLGGAVSSFSPWAAGGVPPVPYHYRPSVIRVPYSVVPRQQVNQQVLAQSLASPGQRLPVTRPYNLQGQGGAGAPPKPIATAPVNRPPKQRITPTPVNGSPSPGATVPMQTSTSASTPGKPPEVARPVPGPGQTVGARTAPPPTPQPVDLPNNLDGGGKYPLTKAMVERWNAVLKGPTSHPERPKVAREMSEFLLAHPEVTLEGRPREIMTKLVVDVLSSGNTGEDTHFDDPIERDLVLIALRDGGFYNLPDEVIQAVQTLYNTSISLAGIERQVAGDILMRHNQQKDRPAAALLKAYESRWPALAKTAGASAPIPVAESVPAPATVATPTPPVLSPALPSFQAMA